MHTIIILSVGNSHGGCMGAVGTATDWVADRYPRQLICGRDHRQLDQRFASV